MDPDGGGRGWECVAESVFSRHWTCSALSTRGSGFAGGEGGQEINIFSLTAERKGWTGLKSYQKK